MRVCVLSNLSESSRARRAFTKGMKAKAGSLKRSGWMPSDSRQAYGRVDRVVKQGREHRKRAQSIPKQFRWPSKERARREFNKAKTYRGSRGIGYSYGHKWPGSVGRGRNYYKKKKGESVMRFVVVPDFSEAVRPSKAVRKRLKFKKTSQSYLTPAHGQYMLDLAGKFRRRGDKKNAKAALKASQLVKWKYPSKAMGKIGR